MQEFIQQKKEVIGTFLKEGVLVSSELLKQMETEEGIKKIIELLKTKKAEDIAVINNIADIQKPEIKSKIEKVRIIESYKDEPKKREMQDFVDYFTARYKGMEKLIKNRQEMASTISINKLYNKKDKENVVIIGMVSDKQVTKNGNIMLKLEDPTGYTKAIINKTKPELFNEAKNIVLDEVIGITGSNINNFVFINSIVWPDIPTTKELKKATEETYAVFLSDLHVGSSKFLPEDFDKFLKWINGETGNEQQKALAKKVEYIFIAGDLVDGVGIYPKQDEELLIKDIYQQYKECAKLLDQIPKHIPLIICPGNHDALRISEPQPLLPKDYAKPLYELSNAIMVSNPCTVNIGATEDFSGFDVLMYHGYSFDHFIAEVDLLRNNGGYDRADLVMKFLLKRRHLGPTHGSTLYLPDQKKDHRIIERVPDFFLSGHIHKSVVANYRNVTMICGSCWQGKTSFQEKVGHNPEPSRVPIVNLKTRDVKVFKFGQ
ncbi:MAG: DNA-directed DNA polymerase II small subunit [Nanoarchaeota archaeon]